MEPELPSTPPRIVLAGASTKRPPERIANDRHLRHLTTQMRDIAAKATALTLKTANSPSPKV